MKSKLSILVLTLLLGSFTAVNAQYGFGKGSKVILESGDIKTIEGQSTVNIEYDYSEFAVGKFKTEAEYVNNKVKEYNDKEAGKGDKWKEGWVNARKERYQPKFEELINDVMAKKGMKFQEAPDAKYTLIVKTTFLEPGYNIGISKQPSFVNYDFIFVETANRSNVVAKLYLQNVVGAQAMGFDYDAGSRIAESYAKAGKMLGKYLLSGK